MLRALVCSWFTAVTFCVLAANAPAGAAPPPENTASAHHDPTDSSNAAQDPDLTTKRTLAEAVSRVNEKLEKRHGVLDPTPLTVSRVRQAIEAATTKVAESDLPDRFAIVEMLQGILSSGRLPEKVDFHLLPGITKYKEGTELGQKAISLNYALIVPTPKGRADKYVLGLAELQEAYRIVKIEPDE